MQSVARDHRSTAQLTARYGRPPPLDDPARRARRRRERPTRDRGSYGAPAPSRCSQTRRSSRPRKASTPSSRSSGSPARRRRSTTTSRTRERSHRSAPLDRDRGVSGRPGFYAGLSRLILQHTVAGRGVTSMRWSSLQGLQRHRCWTPGASDQMTGNSPGRPHRRVVALRGPEAPGRTRRRGVSYLARVEAEIQASWRPACGPGTETQIVRTSASMRSTIRSAGLSRARRRVVLDPENERVCSRRNLRRILPRPTVTRNLDWTGSALDERGTVWKAWPVCLRSAICLLDGDRTRRNRHQNYARVVMPTAERARRVIPALASADGSRDFVVGGVAPRRK